MKRWAATLAACLLLTGCELTSVHPFYQKTDLVWEPALLGTWKTDNGEPFTLEAVDAARREYRATIDSKPFVAHAFRLDGRLFLDLLPDQAADDAGFVPVHRLYRAEWKDNRLVLQTSNYERLDELLKRKPGLVEHVRLVNDKSSAADKESRVVLTAPTREVQRFIRKHLKADEAWSDPTEFRRQ